MSCNWLRSSLVDEVATLGSRLPDTFPISSSGPTQFGLKRFAVAIVTRPLPLRSAPFSTPANLQLRPTAESAQASVDLRVKDTANDWPRDDLEAAPRYFEQ